MVGVVVGVVVAVGIAVVAVAVAVVVVVVVVLSGKKHNDNKWSELNQLLSGGSSLCAGWLAGRRRIYRKTTTTGRVNCN